MRLGIDAMGNDNGPAPIVKGVKLFLAEDADSVVVMVGDRDRVTRAMIDHGIGLSKRLELVHASQVMEMDDKVAELREKRDSSIMRLVTELKEKRVDAIVALGNTAAAVGAATIGLKLIHGVRRPGIAIAMPTRGARPCVVVDMGANTACKPSHLAAYGVMASIYSNKMFGLRNPRVGLLNVGEERSKGNETLREAFSLLEEAPINFIGNVEGGDIFSGACDVVVCDGFIGNAVLKASETLSSTMSNWIKEALYATWYTKLAAFVLQGHLARVKKRLDYTAYGGAPLLGVNGVCLIGHGRSKAPAVASALRSARENVKMQINLTIAEKIERMRHSVRLQAIGGGAGESAAPAPVAAG
ncbi:MAG: phosphate acyltransferase PlsX [Planctomycetota bacterium]|jgi:glycerol-3-phosphate acyltransferase PlsX|nr:phosphate acyltransferase PlsX [Planctomycetota bacterium]